LNVHSGVLCRRATTGGGMTLASSNRGRLGLREREPLTFLP
jgi:hypothetical protein